MKINFDWKFLSDDGVNYSKRENQAHRDDVKNFRAFLQDLKQ